MSSSSTDNSIMSKVLFDDRALTEAAFDSQQSLRLMGNCVCLVNATILCERKLLPAESFRDFCVYGNVYGFMANEKTRDGLKLAEKFRAVDMALQKKLIHKLAIVVDDTVSNDTVETFIWNFAYDSSTSAVAEIGYDGKKSKFTVDYNDMDSTCQQFCKIFSELQRVLKKLKPLPIGMNPSLRVAYRGEAESINGFHRIDKFVDMSSFFVGSVAFPFDNKFHLSCASTFMTEPHRTQQPAHVSNDVSQLHDAMDSFSDLGIEVARQDTMNYEEDDINVRPGDELMDFDDIPYASMSCNPNVASNIDEHIVLQSEVNGNTEADVVPQNEPHAVESQRPVRHPSQKTHAIGVDSDEKSSKRTCHSSKKKKNAPKSKSNAPEKKRKETIESIPQKKRTSRRLSLLVSPKEKQVENSVEPMGIDQTQNSPFSKKFGRVRSLAGVQKEIGRNSDSINETSDKVNNQSSGGRKKYGATNDIVDKHQAGSNNSVIVKTTTLTEQERRYGRVSSIVGETEYQTSPIEERIPRASSYLDHTEKFGRVPSILVLADQPLPDRKTDMTISSVPVSNNLENRKLVAGEERGIETGRDDPNLEDETRFGRVASILDLADQQPPGRGTELAHSSVPTSNNIAEEDREAETGHDEAPMAFSEEMDSANRYGRVSSIKSKVVQHSKKYGHSTYLLN